MHLSSPEYRKKNGGISRSRELRRELDEEYLSAQAEGRGLMKLRESKGRKIYQVRAHDFNRRPKYFDASSLRTHVRISGKESSFVRRPAGNHTSNRVNFELDDKYYYIDDRDLWDLLESDKGSLREFEIVMGSSTSRKRQSKLPAASVGSCTCPENFRFKSTDDLHEACEKKVRCDRQAFHRESIYLPNLIFPTKPKVCFIALEPSIGGIPGMTFDEMLKAISRISCG